MKYLFTCFLAVFLFAQESYSNDIIKWMISEEPPITYKQKDAYKGYGISVIKMLQKNLKNYDHILKSAGNYKRLTTSIKNGPLTCALGLFKTKERLKIMYFSKVPVFYFFNIQIVLRNETFNELNRPKQLSLHNILKDKIYKLGISNGRTYSDTIRKILTEFKGKSNIFIGSQGNIAESLLKMLVAKRIDYMFLYPEEATFLSQKLGFRNSIVTVPIQEAIPFSYAWFACTKNESGKKLSLEVSKILKKIRKEKAYRNLYKQWISRNLIKEYEKSYENDFLKIYEE